MSTLAYTIIALVALARLSELVWARRNMRVLVARGAKEIGRAHYPLIVVLHAAWLAALVLALPRPAKIHWIYLVLFGLLQAVRVWVLLSLEEYFTTRIVTIEGETLVTRGPYRFMRHPNYAVVVGEIACLPLAFGEVGVAVVFSILNTALLAWRIRQEETALSSRRTLSAGPGTSPL